MLRVFMFYQLLYKQRKYVDMETIINTRYVYFDNVKAYLM